MGTSEVIEDGEGEEAAAARCRVAAGGEDACCAVGDSGEVGSSGKTVVVAVRMDAQSRELLTWALVKVAEPGDRVVALHVLLGSAAPSADCSDPGGNSASSSSLVRLFQAFNSVIAVYEGFCNLKQIDLKLKICRGSSLRKTLVREVKDLEATNLIVGIAKNNRTIGSSTSIAKYCAKKLPAECTVVAVSNGKIIFQREASRPVLCLPSTEHLKAKEGKQPAKRPSEVHLTPISKSTSWKDATWCSTTVRRGLTFRRKDRSMSLSCDLELSEICSGVDGSSISSSEEAASNSNCSVCASVSEHDQSKDEESFGKMVASRETEDASSINSHFVKGIHQQRTGWPALRRTLLNPKKNDPERPKVSVARLAMRLPGRHLASAVVHPDHKPSKLAPTVAADVDDDNGVFVLLGTDSSSVSTAASLGEHVKFSELESLHLKYSSTCRLFSYQELQNATSNFSSEKLVGKGGSSRVYKACLPDDRELAVKILKSSEDALKEFILEVEIITTLRHKNIIRLFGFCFENDNLILVYDFLSRGSLEDSLHDEVVSFGWSERYKVAVGVAEALEYLHGAGNAQPVIHRDVKSSNILLGDDYEPQLSDFGLAKWASSSLLHTNDNDVAGTFGYLAPEYFMDGKVNEKIDVYAFGVVLLELLTGRKPINSESPKGEQSLVIWAKPILQTTGKVAQLLDPRIGEQHDADQLERLILAASLCIRRAPRSRPAMAVVLKLLQGDEDITRWAKLQRDVPDDYDELDEEDASPGAASIQSHLTLALLGVEDDSLSVGSTEHAVDQILAHGSLEEYLQNRCGRS